MSVPREVFRLAVVTSCFRYGRYLADWAASLTALARKPDEVGILVHGGLEADSVAARAAADQLRAAHIPVHLVVEPQLLDLGVARNRAVALTTAPWVMHLDADDALLPWAVDDIAALAPLGDVVCLGYERTGDLLAGPRQRSKLYKSSVGRGALANPTPASGVSPFRRVFWEQRPYVTDKRAGGGGWDTALWLGFAHLGARFVPTRRPCFQYRQHADSIFNTRRGSGWPHERMGQRLQGLRRGDQGVSIIVPWSPDDPGREAGWAWVKARYQALYPDWQLLTGSSRRGRWRKGEAVMDALQRATGRVLVIADADCAVPEVALRQAVQLVESGVPWVMPHRKVFRLSPSQTANWLTLDPASWTAPPSHDLTRAPYAGRAGGGIVVVERADYMACGGIPLAFEGWGAEDEALAVILDTLAGQHTRLEYDLVHLWHPPAPGRMAAGGSTMVRNRPLYYRINALRGQPEALWRMVAPPWAAKMRPNVIPVDRTADRAARQAETRQIVAQALQRTAREAKLMNETPEDLQARRRRQVAAFKEGQRIRAEAIAAARGPRRKAEPVEDKMDRPQEDKGGGVVLRDDRVPA